ncbi:hypothetical protein [Brevifollis gellanilyticus]|uniref:Uncharacterized protein n=1 Tax=Brevifollis gellanilyticus TaxID=748831 RepID=A0A512M9G7_9BACT|nr:hypothetical protein [Brevifollis gellanilyticus]GEP43388.1 hypothetical protein BGE01nite_26790 [Brevifollis gellanilyticus]
MERILSGEKLRRQEGRWAYGEKGVPICEEVVARHGDMAITRNSYGSLCLNTPNVFFADVDAHWVPPHSFSAGGCLAFVIAGIAAGFWLHSILLAAAIVIGGPWLLLRITNSRNKRARPEGEAYARQHALQIIHEFVASNPAWHLRVYETPAGYRLLAMHDVFEPGSEAAQQALHSLHSDHQFTMLCALQSCFRARVSPKYWRAGYRPENRLPRQWPFTPEQTKIREEWVAGYDRHAASFASCRFIEELGSSAVHPDAEAVRVIHDDYCKSDSTLPIA